MSLRIIAGKFGSRTIKTPNKSSTHPMSERLRGSLFNMLKDDLSGAMVLDAFAGSGSLGIESISRGAEQAVLVERDRIAQRVIIDNITTLDAKDQISLVSTSVNSFVSHYKSELFDIILADPPYHDLQLSTIKNLTNLLKSNGLMVISYPGRCEVPELDNKNIVVVDNRSYGTAALAFYRRVK